MKSKLTYLICLIASICLYAQTPDTAVNTPGEDTPSNSYSEESSVDKIRALSNKIDRQKEKIERLYIKEEETLAAYGGGTTVVKTELKKNIYKAGNILIADQEDQLKQLKADQNQERLAILRKIDKIQDKLVYYIRQPKTRPIEKQLKKLKSAEEIYPVFISGSVD